MRGYYRHPTINRDRVVFVSEDDLWAVGVDGGAAHRLTANPGAEAHPRLSPDGKLLAFTSRDEGRSEVHVMDAEGGPARRLSFMGATTQVVGWSADSGTIICATDWQQPFTAWLHLWSIPANGGAPTPMGLGPGRAISYQRNGPGVVISRNSFDPARWKRYRGGLTGSLWIDRNGEGQFTELVRLPGNLADPMWVGRRVFFLSDHEGVGNIYSVTPTGANLRRHTHHQDFYARFPSTDGYRIVYHCGADLWLLDRRGEDPRRIEVELPSARPQRNRRFMSPGRFLESISLHPKGHSLAVVARGGAFNMPLWEGAPVRHGAPSRYRRRLAHYLADGERVVAVTDETGEESLVVHRADGQGEPRFVEKDIGRARSLDPAPAGADRVAVSNHRHELVVIDLARGSRRLIHRSPHSWIAGSAWSPDGRWLAFSAAVTRSTRNLFLYDSQTRRLTQIGRPDFTDVAPSFDPEGRFLYFLSGRVFDPVPDAHFHDFGFPRGFAPYLLPLRADQASPFAPSQRDPRPPGGPPPGAEGKDDQPVTVNIDLDGLEQRVVALPVSEARYVKVGGARGRILLLSYPLAGALNGAGETPKGRLEAWDLQSDRLDQVMEGVSGFTVSSDGKVLAIRADQRLRVVPSNWKDDKNPKDNPGRDTGWVDLDRIRLEVLPGDEWRQMFSEAWRLQRDNFWWEEMGGVDWIEVHNRYLPLCDRVASRAEFSDLMWEMQGELGTSHAYELRGDYRPEPVWNQGRLGADLTLERGGWRVRAIPGGDSWVVDASSPLAAPGVDVRPGDRLLAIDGADVGRHRSPYELLVDKGGREVVLTVRRGRQGERRVVVRALVEETSLRYRDWVEQNRQLVDRLSEGRAGYIHIPDMQAWGFSEFHRYWRAEVDKEGLVIDVRFNQGGNVSQLLLEKLTRRRLAYQITRWRQPIPIPRDSPRGPMVCITNERSGSDGDIFSHTFKLHRLGPLIGTRTWGGVVGIWPQHALVDGTVTTQPEFAFWFTDAGYRVENLGTTPDIEVVITPQDYRVGRDPQLERGVEELLKLIDDAGPLVPDFGERPSVRPPQLPPIEEMS